MRVTKANLRQIVREAVKARLQQLDEGSSGVTNDAEMAMAALQRLNKAVAHGNVEAAREAWRQANFYLTSVRRQLESV